MPIVYVHGVNVRRKDDGYEAGLDRLKAYLRRYVAPEISDDPDGVPFLPAYWGDDGVSFAWDGRSRPATQFLGMGAGDGAGLAERVSQVAAVPGAYAGLSATAPVVETAPSGLIAAGPAADESAPLTGLSDDELSDVLATAALLATADEAERTLLTIAARTRSRTTAGRGRRSPRAAAEPTRSPPRRRWSRNVRPRSGSPVRMPRRGSATRSDAFANASASSSTARAAHRLGS